MKRITIDLGLVLLLTLIIFVIIMAFAEMKNGTAVFDNFSSGYLFGILMMLGIFMLNRNITFEKRYKKWRLIEN